MQFDALIVTASNAKQAEAYNFELQLRKSNGLISKHVEILEAVPDPSDARIGSGGATLNALLFAAQKFSANAGFSGINIEFLMKKKILILHSGGDSKRIPIASVRGKAFCALPCVDQEDNLIAPIDLLIEKICEISCNVKSGCFVASTDVLVDIPRIEEIQWADHGVTCLAIPANAKKYGSNHGVFKIKKDSVCSGLFFVNSFFQKPSFAEIEENELIIDGDKVLIDSGILYMSPVIVNKMISLVDSKPFDCSTYSGMDNGNALFRFEIYTDFLMSFNIHDNHTDKARYIEMDGDGYNKANLNEFQRIIDARRVLLNQFQNESLFCTIAIDGYFGHVGTTKEYIEMATTQNHFSKFLCFKSMAHSNVDLGTPVTDNVCLINSLVEGYSKIEPGCLIENSHLRGCWEISSGSICSGIQRMHGGRVLCNVVIQEITLNFDSLKNQFGNTFDHSVIESYWVLIVFGVFDDIKGSFRNSKSTFLNVSWDSFFKRSGLTQSDLWNSNEIQSGNCSLWNAKLFPILSKLEDAEITLWLQYNCFPSSRILRKWKHTPRLSLSEIALLSDSSKEFSSRQDIAYKCDFALMEHILQNNIPQSIRSSLKRLDLSRMNQALLHLDRLAEDASFPVISRVFFTIADILCLFPGADFFSRSGPSRNVEWAHSFDLLHSGKIKEGIFCLARVRSKWMNSSDPHTFMRAARHYEAASQIFIRKIVEESFSAISCKKMINASKYWKEITCAARIDLAGGWGDTLPISFEHGGLVLNAAVLLEDTRPIGCRSRVIEELKLLISSGTYSKVQNEIECFSVSDLKDYCDPLAPGSLVKSSILALKLVDIASNESLQEQILRKIGGGLHIITWSDLPKGSGLGTSSILAAAVMRSIASACGLVYSDSDYVYLVLMVEQYLTTGGGWQDQIGGIYPGFKASFSKKGLPIEISTECLQLDSEWVEKFESHCVLVYTGVPRLAKYLLQSVLRNWAHRDSITCDLFDRLYQTAENMKRALLAGNIDSVGKLLTEYWNQKRLIAQGSDTEPLRVSEMMSKLKSLIFGYSLAGAGGGGFVILITRDPNMMPEIKSLLEDEIENQGASIHSIKIDRLGWTEQEKSID